MKKVFLFSLVIIGFAFSSCSSDDDNTTTSEDHFTAKIDGNEFEATNLMATNGILLFQISGTGDQGNMAFNFNNNDISVGTFDFDGVNYVGSFDLGSDGWSAESGSITITKYEDGRVEGTFNFIGENNLGLLDPTAPDINVTEGSFAMDHL